MNKSLKIKNKSKIKLTTKKVIPPQTKPKLAP